ncbi:PH domain-containing protein [Acanthopleuribacter pedis]|uniref:PH domain-containing protein n=1 Tax=Acanthopleuribacter pedis TaxID=442870 RepID=A0A8J7QB66_9BACT|nr:PH domain-containing protein [Acanthopleuribacter pedis]MBO1320449.1 PH domain-containing protein [Acanthopleuribacter pedis]
MQTSEIPEDWQALHPTMLLFGSGEMISRLILPLVFVFLLNPASFGMMFWVGIAVLTSMSTLLARYASFRYATIDGSICIREGIFSKKVRRIPAKRIHNINIRQNLVARRLNVVRLDIETAGGGAAEASLPALSHGEAQRLFAYWRREKSGEIEAADTQLLAEDDATPFYRISHRDILVAGATTHRLGIIFVAFAGLFQLFEDRIFNSMAGQGPELLQQGVETVQGLGDQSWWQVALLVCGTLITLLFTAWMLSIITAFIRWYQFTIRHNHDSVSIKTGLFTLRQYNFPLNKVQALRCRITPLRRPLGLMQIFVQSAGHVGFQDGGQGESDLLVPITAVKQTQHFVQCVWPNAGWNHLAWRPVHKYTRTRQFRQLLLLLAVLITALIAVYAGETWAQTLAVLLTVIGIPASWVIAHATWRQTGYAFDLRFVYVKTGFLGLHYWVIPLSKIQNAAVHQTPFQYVRGLAELQLDVAGSGSGAIFIPNIDVKEAWLMFNRFINPRPGTDAGW